MGTLWLWEPEPLRALIFEGLGKGQVPIKLTGSGGCEHREQLVLHTLEHALPEAGRAPFVECIQLVGRIGPQIHLGGLKACSAIHCCFVYVFVELRVSSIVSHQWVCPCDAPLSSSRSRWPRFPAYSGTIRALRLPAPPALRFFDSPAGSVDDCAFVSATPLPSTTSSSPFRAPPSARTLGRPLRRSWRGAWRGPTSRL